MMVFLRRHRCRPQNQVHRLRMGRKMHEHENRESVPSPRMTHRRKNRFLRPEPEI